MKIETVKELGIWTASYGAITTDGRTKKEAIEACKKLRQARLEFVPQKPRIMIASLRIFVFTKILDGGGVMVQSFKPDGTPCGVASCDGTMESVYESYKGCGE